VAVYSTAYSIQEDKQGQTAVTIALAGSYTEVFDIASSTAVDVLAVGGLKESFAQEDGIFRVDELSLTIDESAIITSADQAAAVYALSAQSESSPRYFAVFIGDTSTPASALSSLLFVGKVQPDMKATDIEWRGAEWSASPLPLRRWEAQVMSAGVAIFDTLKIKDMLAELRTNAVYSAEWARSNWGKSGSKVQGYACYTHPTDAQKSFRYTNMVGFNDALDALCKVIESKSNEWLGFGLIIRVRKTLTDFSAAPVRWARRAYLRSAGSGWAEVANSVSNIPSLHCGTQLFTPGNSGSVNTLERTMYRIQPENAKRLILGFTGNEVGAQPMISAYMLHPLADDRSLSFEQYDSFSDFVFGVARTFGMYVKIERKNPEAGKEVYEVVFEPRSAIALADMVEIPDAHSASVSVRGTESSKPSGYHARTTRYTGESEAGKSQGGTPGYSIDSAGGVIPSTGQQPNGDRLLFGIGGVHRLVGDKFLPHGGAFFDGETMVSADNPAEVAQGFSSMIFMTTVFESAPVLSVANGVIEHALVRSVSALAPVGCLYVQFNNQTTQFSSLAEYVEYVAQKSNEPQYSTEYEISVPYLTRFRRVSSSSTSAHNLRPGRKLTLDGREYVITEVERDFVNVETKLKLARLSRYAFASTQDGALYIGSDMPIVNTSTQAQDEDEFFECVTPVVEGNAVAVMLFTGVGRVAMNANTGSLANLFVGIAMQTLTQSEIDAATASGTRPKLRVRTRGIVELPRYAGLGILNAPIFVRSRANDTDLNLSATPPNFTSISATQFESAHLRIGFIVRVSANACAVQLQPEPAKFFGDFLVAV
jgi:hypothetical protein